MLHSLLGLVRPFIIFDFESSGMDPQTARAWSLAMRVWQPDGSVTQYHTFIDPTIELPTDISERWGVTRDTIRYGCAKCGATTDLHPHGTCVEFKPTPTFADLAEKLLSGFLNADFSGYNPFYDIKLAAAEFGRCGLEFDYSTAAVIDAKRVWQLLEPRTLSDAVEYFLQRKHVGAHEAMADVIAAEDVLIAQLTKHARSETLPKTVRELHDLSWPRDADSIDTTNKFKFVAGVPCFNFGKHKGQPMHTQRGYLQWMFKGDFSPEVKKIVDLLSPAAIRSRRNPMTGTIVRLTDKGFGFIRTADGSEYFFHHTAVTNAKFEDLMKGATVVVELEEGPKGPRCGQVTVQ